MKKAILCLGSNVADANQHIARALELLKSQGCEVLKTTNNYPSASGYSNRVVEVGTMMGHEELKSLAKQIEILEGRQPWMKEAGIVPIDIDVVMYGGAVVRPLDYATPYFTEGYNKL
ncbi:MAG: 2-amino-4-hydroxy-6-hydroxymethyldihydropteridine diphosphokinase [Bacteroidales bacterium]|nr:2-amino-4-hydroxy-6-hydroxymethyldihydropteridine diphosphokinase [Bacteroidales bacterium]